MSFSVALSASEVRLPQCLVFLVHQEGGAVGEVVGVPVQGQRPHVQVGPRGLPLDGQGVGLEVGPGRVPLVNRVLGGPAGVDVGPIRLRDCRAGGRAPGHVHRNGAGRTAASVGRDGRLEEEMPGERSLEIVAGLVSAVVLLIPGRHHREGARLDGPVVDGNVGGLEAGDRAARYVVVEESHLDVEAADGDGGVDL